MNPLRAKELVIDIPDRGDGQPLDFTVEPGQMWGVLGPNGAGKTTLLHTLAGLRPTTCSSGLASVPDNTTKVSPACAHTLSAARQMGHFAAVCGTLHLHTARQRLAPVDQSHPPR